MIQKNHSFRPLLLAALFCGTSTVSLLAQNAGGPPPEGGRGPRGPHHGPSPNALFDALDTNHDGVLSAEEMDNATASLKGLLKDGATQLKRDDLRPTPPAQRTSADGGPAAPESVDADADAPRPHGGPERRGHRPPPPSEDRLAPDAESPRLHDHEGRGHRPPPPAIDDRDDDDAAPRPHLHHRMHGHRPPMPADEQDAPDRDQDRPEHHARPDFAPRGEEGRPGGPGPRGHHHGPPASPLFDALDTNHDGVISDEEMTSASASIKGLLKDGATQLRREDLRPAQPPQDRREDRPNADQ